MSKKKIAFLSLSVALMLLLIGGALFGQATQKNSPYRYLSIFTEVFDLVRNNYVEAVTSDQLMDGAFAAAGSEAFQVLAELPRRHLAAVVAPLQPLGLDEALGEVVAERIDDDVVGLERVDGVL